MLLKRREGARRSTRVLSRFDPSLVEARIHLARRREHVRLEWLDASPLVDLSVSSSSVNEDQSFSPPQSRDANETRIANSSRLEDESRIDRRRNERGALPCR